MKKEKIISPLIIVSILLIVGIVIYFKNNPTNQTPEALARCIGEKSTLYTLSTCFHCKDQEAMFGENVEILNIIVCDKDETSRQSCIDAEIQATPTWIINNQSYVGVQSIENLKKITNC